MAQQSEKGRVGRGGGWGGGILANLVAIESFDSVGDLSSDRGCKMRFNSIAKQ